MAEIVHFKTYEEEKATGVTKDYADKHAVPIGQFAALKRKLSDVKDCIMKADDDAKRDEHSDTMDLVKGVCHDPETEQVHLFKAVREAHSLVSARLGDTQVKRQDRVDFGYAASESEKEFRIESAKLILGDLYKKLCHRVATIASVGGTGAVYFAAQLLAITNPKETPVYISDPSWPNYRPIFETAGLKVCTYTYVLLRSTTLEFAAMTKDLCDAPDYSIVVLQCVGHNPTGCDPTRGEWQELLRVIQTKKHRVVFDCAYQGFGSGNLDDDAYPVRLFANNGCNVLVCQSYSKTMGLYGERCGCLVAVCNDEQEAGRVTQYLSQVVIRRTYSTTPRAAHRLAQLVLTRPELRREWENELRKLYERNSETRTSLVNKLNELMPSVEWELIRKQCGLFVHLGLTEAQCEHLAKQHIYVVPPHGRVCVGVLMCRDIDRLAMAIRDAMQQNPHRNPHL